jgi:hypothetical protein
MWPFALAVSEVQVQKPRVVDAQIVVGISTWDGAE